MCLTSQWPWILYQDRPHKYIIKYFTAYFMHIWWHFSFRLPPGQSSVEIVGKKISCTKYRIHTGHSLEVGRLSPSPSRPVQHLTSVRFPVVFVPSPSVKVLVIWRQQGCRQKSQWNADVYERIAKPVWHCISGGVRVQNSLSKRWQKPLSHILLRPSNSQYFIGQLQMGLFNGHTFTNLMECSRGIR